MSVKSMFEGVLLVYAPPRGADPDGCASATASKRRPRCSGSRPSCPSTRSARRATWIIDNGGGLDATSRAVDRVVGRRRQARRPRRQAVEEHLEHLRLVGGERGSIVATQRAHHVTGEHHLGRAEDHVARELGIDAGGHLAPVACACG